MLSTCKDLGSRLIEMARVKTPVRRSSPGDGFRYSARPYIDIDDEPSKLVHPSALECLNNDVIKYLIDFLTPGALRCLILANRKMRCLVLPKLYTNLNLYLDDSLLCRIGGLLKPQNPGLKFIRRVVITPGFGDDFLKNADVQSFVQNFVEVIPAYKLRYFRWASRGPFLDLARHWLIVTIRYNPQFRHKGAIAHTLWRWHPALTNIQVVESGFVSDLFPSHEFLQFMPDCRALEVVPQTEAALVPASQALKQCKITSLHVDALHWELGKPERNSVGAVEDDLTEKLFTHCRSVSFSDSPLKIHTLRHLTLKDLDLRYFRDTWFRYLEFTGLESLSIEYCEHADKFLAEINKKPPALEHFAIVHTVGPEDNTMNELNRLLQLRRNCLKSAVFCIRKANDMLRTRAINAHNMTLRRLVLDVQVPFLGGDGESRPRLYSPKGLNIMLKGCTNLAQLALYTPKPSIEYMHFDHEVWDFYKTLASNLPTHARMLVC